MLLRQPVYRLKPEIGHAHGVMVGIYQCDPKATLPSFPDGAGFIFHKLS